MSGEEHKRIILKDHVSSCDTREADVTAGDGYMPAPNSSMISRSPSFCTKVEEALSRYEEIETLESFAALRDDLFPEKLRALPARDKRETRHSWGVTAHSLRCCSEVTPG